MSAPKAAAAVATAVKYTSAFRAGGLTYLDALGVASGTLRRVLKEPFKSEATGKSNYKYREFTYESGKESPACELRAAGWVRGG